MDETGKVRSTNKSCHDFCKEFKEWWSSKSIDSKRSSSMTRAPGLSP